MSTTANNVVPPVVAPVANLPPADTKVLLVENIPQSIKNDCATAFDRMYNAYNQADTGIFALEAKIEHIKEKSVGGELMRLARLAVTNAPTVERNGKRVPDMRLVGPLFSQYCEVGANHLRAKHVEDDREPPIAELVPSYPTYKAGILKAMQEGHLDPTAQSETKGEDGKAALEYPTANKFITAGKKAAGGGDTRTTTKPATPEERAKALNTLTSGFAPNLQTSLGLLIGTLGLCDTPELQSMAFQEVSEAQSRIHRNCEAAHKARAKAEGIGNATTGDADADAAAAAKIAAEKEEEETKARNTPKSARNRRR